MPRRNRAWTMTLLALSLLGLLGAGWLISTRQEPRVAEIVRETGCGIAYLAGPPAGDALQVSVQAPRVGGSVNVSAQRLDGASMWNAQILDGETAVWAFNQTRGLLRVACQSSGAAPVLRYAWIGNATVLLGETVQDLVVMAGVERSA